jgi:uracil-DNA glycosylase family 4
MDVLPLYPDLPYLATEETDGLQVNAECERCPLHEPYGRSASVKHVCMSPEGKPGGALFVADHPGNKEDALGRLFVDKAGRYVRNLVKEMWSGPVAFDYAVKCKPGERQVTDSYIRKCRPYLAKDIADIAPDRIITFGNYAAKAVLGFAMPAFSARPRGWGWVAGSMTPVFFLMDPAETLTNRFIKQWFEEDLRWALTCDVSKLAAKSPWESVVTRVRTQAEAQAAVDEARRSRFAAYDCETAGEMYEDGSNPDEPAFRLLCTAVAAADAEDCWLWDDAALADPSLSEALREILERPDIPIVGQNEKYDRKTVKLAKGWNARGFHSDTRLKRKLVNPDADAKLKTMQSLIGMAGGKDEMTIALHEVIKTCRKKPTRREPDRGSDEWLEEQFPGRLELAKAVRSSARRDVDPKRYAYGLVERDLLHRYCAADTLSTAALEDRLAEDMAAVPELQSVWDKLVHDAALAIAQVEEWGVSIDRDAVEAFQSCVMLEHQDAAARIFACARQHGLHTEEREFKPDKPEDIAELLFGKLKLRVPKRTATGKASTDATVLDMLKGKHPIVEDVAAYRKVGKQKGTYADPITKFIRSDGRIHTTIHADGARTGRASSSDPNLQNIPRGDTPQGKMARDCFAPPPGRVLIQFDYSQLELRVAAMESGDKNMIQIFLDGHDYHQRTAELVSKTAWGIRPEQVEKKHRSQAKAVNFGVLYGMGAYALAHRLNSTPEEAEQVMSAVMGGFRDLDRYCKSQLRYAQRHGHVWTTWDGALFRRRGLWRVVDSVPEVKSRAEHGAWNTPIQGKASDYCLFSLVECVQWIKEEGLPVKLVLPVHDSLLFEVPFDYVEEVLYVVPRIMRQWPSGGVPLVVDSEMGPSWGSLVSVVEKDGAYFCEVKDEEAETKLLVPWREFAGVGGAITKAVS